MGKPNLSKIIELLDKGQDFELTNQQYKYKTGLDFPKNNSYAKNKSSVAKMAARYDYIIEIIPQRILFKKNGL